MSNLTTLPKGDSAWLLRKSIQRIMQQVSVLETNIGSSTTGNSSNTQVIFNDNGTLRGDAGLTYNAATDTLSAGSATITGDLTVDTQTLKVDSANNRVGVGTASPLTTFQVQDAALTGAGQIREQVIRAAADNANNSLNSLVGFTFSTGSAAYTAGTLVRTAGVYGINLDNSAFGRAVGLSFYTCAQDAAATEKYRIDSTGVATWSNVGGVAGTAMTLNATGLGVGASPTAKLDVNGNVIIRDTFNLTMGFGNQQRILAGGGSDNTFLTFSQWTGAAYTERMRIDQSGNVGIGVAPSAWSWRALQVGAFGGFLATNSAAYASYLGSNCYYDGSNWRYIATSGSVHYEIAGGDRAHKWYNAPSGTAGNAITFTQVMTLDASGNLLVGTTTNTGSARIYTEVNGNGHVVKQMSAGGYCFGANAFSNGGTYYLTYFEAAGTAVGSITSNGTGVTYGTLSDYRLKEAVQPLVGGLARVSALKPSIYKWKSNGSSGEGFLAHELAEVVPAAVTGEKDAVNEDGTVNPQGVDLSKVVPILVAAIQELTARVQTLEAK